MAAKDDDENEPGGSVVDRVDFQKRLKAHETYLKSGDESARLTLKDTKVEGVQGTELDIGKAVFDSVRFRHCTFWKTNFDEAVFDGSNLKGTVFENSSFKDAKMRGVMLRGASFRGADLTGADLSPFKPESGGAETASDLSGPRPWAQSCKRPSFWCQS